jgi:general L-amino acid transport system permease protein
MESDRAKLRRIAYQAAALAVVCGFAFLLLGNAVQNLEARRIASGFAFLARQAGFEIGETAFIAYGATDSYLRALAVGLANTLKVSVLAIILATLLGTVIGLAAFSSNVLSRQAGQAYVEFIRNVPLLVQLLFWYTLLTALPHPREALQPLPGVFLSNRGIAFPLPGSTPVLEGFNFSGGATLGPEFAALLAGLVVYSAAFIGEIVRAGVLSVRRGQVEAARALGLGERDTLRHVVAPQALRVIVPPLASQYLNVVKNSSLAVAIGYQHLVSVANTTMNQTGQAIEGVAIIMAAYLTISLAISAFMNWYNARINER